MDGDAPCTAYYGIYFSLFVLLQRILKPATFRIEIKKRKVQGVPQSQTADLPRHQEEAETDKSKQAQTEKTYEKH